MQPTLTSLGFIRSDTNNERYINFAYNIVLQIDKKCDNADKMYVKTINGVPIEQDVLQKEWIYIADDLDVFREEVMKLAEICLQSKEQDGYKSGRIARIEPKIKYSERFNKQVLVIDTNDSSYSKRISIDFVNTYINLLSGISIGDEVLVYFAVSGKDIGREGDLRNVTSLQAVNLEKI